MNSRRRRETLLGLAIVLVAIAVAGWLALTGRVDWLARLAKPRIERALLAAGIEADALDIERLSLGGGRIEHARMRFEGGTAEIHGLEVALGLGNIAARRAGAIRVDRLDIELSESSASSSDAALPKLEGLPFDSIEVREWRIAVPIVATIKHASGSLRATWGENDIVHFEGSFAANEANGRFAGDYDGRSPGLVLRIADAAIAPEGMLLLQHTMPGGGALAGLSLEWERAVADAEITLDSAGPTQASANVELAQGAFARHDVHGGLAAATIALSWKRGDPLAVELDATGGTLSSGPVGVAAETLQLIGGSAGGSVSLGRAVVTSGGREARGHGLGSFALGKEDGGLSAEGTWILESAKFDGFTTGGAEVALGLKGGVLTAETTDLALGGRVRADFEELELAFTDLGGDAPGVSGRAVANVDAAGVLPKGTEMSPARERVSATFLGMLGAGRESMRVEFQLADAQRTIRSDAFSGGFIGALAGVVTLDSSHVSTSAAGEWKNVSLSVPGQGSASFPEAKFKWSTVRVWTDSIHGWPQLQASRVLRELLWISSIDLRATGGAVDLGEYGSASGVSATVVSNGADISERAGGSLVLSAKSVHAADRDFSDFGATLDFGLDGGTVVADVALVSPRIPVRSRQSIDWHDGFAFGGTYATETVDLASAGPLGGLLPILEGITGSGTVSASGPLRLGPNGFESGARVELGAVGLSWPDDKMTFAGISGVIDFDSLRPLHANDGQRLTVGSAKLQDITFTDGVLEFGIPSPDSVTISRLDAHTLGGAISAAPFAFDPADPKPATSVRLDGLRLERLLGFFPDVPADAEGGIVGLIPVSWNGQQLEFGTGFIDLQPGELGHVTFDYDMRMLSAGREDERVFYPVLRRVEKAIRDLHFNRLRIDLYPTDNPGRSMQIRIAGVTTTEDIHAPVELDINIDAPLDRFIKWGTNPVKP